MKPRMNFYINLLILLNLIADNFALARSAPPQPNNNCPLIDDAKHAVMLADPADCSKYFSCLKGMAYGQQCPNNLHWNTLTYRCDYPDKTICDFAMPATTINQAPANTLAASLTGEILYKLHANDCSRYYKCQTLACPNNYHWNFRTQKCDFPHNVQCPLHQIPNASGAFEQEALQIQASEGDIIALRYPNDCAKFLECQTMLCPVNYHWNLRLKQCDLPHIAECSLQPEVTAMSATSTVGVPTAFTAPPTSTVSTQINGNVSAACLDCGERCDSYLHHYLPHPYDCHKFIQCNGWSFIHTCPDNLFWNAKLNTCDRICVAN